MVIGERTIAGGAATAAGAFLVQRLASVTDFAQQRELREFLEVLPL